VWLAFMAFKIQNKTSKFAAQRSHMAQISKSQSVPAAAHENPPTICNGHMQVDKLRVRNKNKIYPSFKYCTKPALTTGKGKYEGKEWQEREQG
jgi:hypothetical protein